MPRFSEHEKEQIRTKLFAEGERLFVAYGLKKVTIDELVSAVKIAKASFYTFYENKEYLYLDIVQRIQQHIFSELSALLHANTALSNKQRVRHVFDTMYLLLSAHPILAQIDNSTLELISRKVSSDRLAAFVEQNLDACLILNEHGIQFTCTPQIASYTFQTLYRGWLSLQDKEDDVQKAVADILLNGVIEQIIKN